MKIVEIINALMGRNGAQIFLLNLCISLKQKENVDLFLISLHGNVEKHILEEIGRNKIKFIVIEKRRGIDFKASFQLKRVLKEIDPDIVHMHLSCLPTYFISHGLTERKFKLIQTFHTVPNKELNFLAKAFIRMHLISYVGISNEITKCAQKKCKKIQCQTIYNGLPIAQPLNNDFVKKEYDFIIVASMTPVKNHKLLFSAFLDVLKKHRNKKIICVGGGYLLNENKEYAKSLGIYQNIIFTGEVSNVYDYLLASKCFVLSSIREGNPISILEAMNAGLPIIAPSVGGIPDVVKNESNGFLFDANNQNQLTTLMERAISEEALFQSIGENNKRDVKQYDINSTATQYLKLFKRLCAK